MLIKPISFWQQPITAAIVPPVDVLPRLAVSSSLYAYHDFAFTASYSASGQTIVYDLSGNNNTGSVNGTLNYQPITSGSAVTKGTYCLMQPAANDTNNVQMRQVNLSGNYTMVCSWYMKNPLYSFNYTEIFVGREPEAYGILAQNNANSFRAIVSNNDNLSSTQLPINSGTGSNWHVSQFSFNDTTNEVVWCMDGTTGSFTLASATSTGIVSPRWNNGGNNTGFDPYLGSGSMVQVMAVYTGSLTADQMVQNWNSLKGRYDLV